MERNDAAVDILKIANHSEGIGDDAESRLDEEIREINEAGLQSVRDVLDGTPVKRIKFDEEACDDNNMWSEMSFSIGGEKMYVLTIVFSEPNQERMTVMRREDFKENLYNDANNILKKTGEEAKHGLLKLIGEKHFKVTTVSKDHTMMKNILIPKVYFNIRPLKD